MADNSSKSSNKDEFAKAYAQRKREHKAPASLHSSIFESNEATQKSLFERIFGERSSDKSITHSISKYFKHSALVGAIAVSLFVVFIQLKDFSQPQYEWLESEAVSSASIVRVHSVEGETIRQSSFVKRDLAKKLEYTEYRESFLAQQNVIKSTVGATDTLDAESVQMRIIDNQNGLALINCESEVTLITQLLLNQMGMTSTIDKISESQATTLLAERLAVGNTVTIGLDKTGRIVFFNTNDPLSSNTMTCSS